jgi:excisionase family DNA binding protein
MSPALDARLQAFTIEEVARRLRVKASTVLRLIRRGELSARRVGTAWRVPAPALDSYLTPPSDDGFDDEPLSARDLASIKRGLADIKAGRTISRTELNRKLEL